MIQSAPFSSLTQNSNNETMKRSHASINNIDATGIDISHMLWIDTFSVLSLQLKKQRSHNESAIYTRRPFKRQLRSRPQRGAVRRTTSHIMVTALLLLKPTRIQITTKSLPAPTAQERRKLLRVKTMSSSTNYSTVSTVRSAASVPESEIQDTEMTVWCAAHPPKSSKVTQKVFSSRRVTRRQVMRHFTSNGTDQCQNSSSNLLTPYREQPRSARIVVESPRPAFSATRSNQFLTSPSFPRPHVMQK